MTNFGRIAPDEPVFGVCRPGHLGAGLGRTGVVSAAWLTRERGYGPRRAIETVENVGRASREAVRCDNATTAELLDLQGG